MKSLYRFGQLPGFLPCTLAIAIAYLRELDPVAQTPASNQATLIITVNRRDGNQPLAGVRVSVRLGDKSEPVGASETDAAGKCTVKWTKDWKGAVLARAEKSGFAPLQMSWQGIAEEDAPPEEFTFLLSPSETVGGRLLDQAGQPVADARISLNFPQRLTGPRVPVDGFTVQTDAEGRWKMEIVPAGVTSLRVTATHPNCVAPDGSKDVQPSLASLRDQSSVIRLERVLELSGRVLSPEGKPVSGAKVVRGSEWGIMGVEDNMSTETDAKGEFRFERLKAGKVMIVAEAPGFGPAIANAEVRVGAPPVELRLQAPHVLRGLIKDLAGKPIEGVRIRADDWERYRYPGWEATTDAEGRFVFSNMPPGTVSLDITKAGYMGRLMHRFTVGEPEQILALGPILRLHGRVLDAATGEPVAQFKMTPGWPRQVFREGKLENSGGEWANYDTKQFGKGAYDWTFNRPIVAGTTQPYDFLLRVEAEGYDPGMSRAFKPDEGDATFDFQLKKGTGLKGLVKLPDGTPVANAKVYAFTGYNWPYMQNGLVQGGSRATEYITGPDGSFKMSKPIEPMNLLVVHDWGLAEHETGGLETSEEIVLHRWAGIRGILRVGNQIGAKQKVALRFPTRYERQGEGLRQKMTGPRNYEVVTDEQGRFEFDRVPAGEIGIVRVIDLPRPSGVGISFGDVWGGCPAGAVRVKPGERADIALGGDGCVVTAQLLPPENLKQPVDWANGQFMISLAGPKIEPPAKSTADRLQTWLDEWFWSDAGRNWRRWLVGTPQVMGDGMIPGFAGSWYVKVETDGRIRIEDLPPGEYLLNGWLNGPPVSEGRFQQPGRAVATLRHPFKVPEPASGRDAVPVDLGRISLDRAEEPPTPAPRPPASPQGWDPNDPISAIQVAEPDLSRLLTASASVHPTKLKPGEGATLFIKVKVARGYSIAALAEGTETKGATTINVELPEKLSAEGSWQARQPFMPGRSLPMYYREVAFSRPLKLASDAKAGQVNVRCDLHYQVSNQMLAWPQSTIHLETSLDVVVSP
ncbi:MAG: carboxypeptidase regulatory-like domain-containing protein [Verrucomicrobia bacterium]|nr:carboxypeptidase regulatory-like domain-containing protein [Verrucomicrobiota bacterium]